MIPKLSTRATKIPDLQEFFEEMRDVLRLRRRDGDPPDPEFFRRVHESESRGRGGDPEGFSRVSVCRFAPSYPRTKLARREPRDGGDAPAFERLRAFEEARK
jgi:hypothetical protein